MPYANVYYINTVGLLALIRESNLNETPFNIANSNANPHGQQHPPLNTTVNPSLQTSHNRPPTNSPPPLLPRRTTLLSRQNRRARTPCPPIAKETGRPRRTTHNSRPRAYFRP